MGSNRRDPEQGALGKCVGEKGRSLRPFLWLAPESRGKGSLSKCSTLTYNKIGQAPYAYPRKYHPL